MKTGTVRWFAPHKGYGWITPDDGGGDLFVHLSSVESAGWASLTEGEAIAFDVVTKRGRVMADNLRRPGELQRASWAHPVIIIVAIVLLIEAALLLIR